MSEPVPVMKNDAEQMPIPTEWRGVLAAIVSSLKNGDFKLTQRIAGVLPISEEIAKAMANNIERYGAQLTSLPEESWQTSACQWMDSFWDVLVDLFTIEEGASDLVLAARVYESNNGYSFEVQSVHVP